MNERERPDLSEIGRETNFTDTVTLYELINPEDGGTGRGLFYTPDAADKEAEPGEVVAQQAYCRAGEPTYVDK